MSHFLLMLTYAAMISAFFALLWRREKRRQATLFVKMWASLVGFGTLLAWLMYLFPSGPPAPFP